MVTHFILRWPLSAKHIYKPNYNKKSENATANQKTQQEICKRNSKTKNSSKFVDTTVKPQA